MAKKKKKDNIEKEISLKVAEAQQDDVNKGIVRIDSQIMKQLGISQGSIVEIEGNKKTAAIAGRAFPADLGLAIIRMDGYTRRNAKTSIGEHVTIRKTEVQHAESITIAPAQKGVSVKIVGEGSTEGIKRALLGRAMVKGDLISLGGTRRRRRTFHGSPFEEIFADILEDSFGTMGMPFARFNRFVVVATQPKGPVVVTENTKLDLKPEAVDFKEETLPDVTYEDIGGLTEEIKKVREMIEIPLKHPELFEQLGIQPPKGVLLYGPPGTGKTLLAKAVATESNATFMSINGPEIMSKFVGEAEKKLREIFENAEKNAPAIVFIDEIDAIASKRGESFGEVERRVVAQLLALMDGLKSRGKIIVIAATNRQDALDPALRRGGRFDREIEIGVPNKTGRLNILKIHTRNMPLEDDVDLKKLADVTHGFVGADLEGLCKEAAMSVLRRIIPAANIQEEEKIPKKILDKLKVKKLDFKEALKLVRPSAMREVLIESPKVKWEQVGGLKKAKQELQEAVEWPIKHPKAFKRMGIRPPQGIMLYGPSGCGKTLLAKAVATESEANFISVKGPEVLSKWVGESEKAIREIFKKARQVAPCIIFFDEIDAIASRRGSDAGGSRVGDKVVNQILTEIDGLEDLNDVAVIAATNRPELIDSALLRPGRFDRHILVTQPNQETRKQIFEIHTNGMPLAKDVNLEKLAKKTENYSGADIEAICREAAMLSLRKDLKADKVELIHFERALKDVKPSLSKNDTEKYVTALAESKLGKTSPDYMS
ncbi:CDC48 family AAA ATPase [Candidatus Woesearchaeota archaeon]|nr:CDC48 family AAA ATPase [Candidatus Woesearchaeota archaeon]